MLETIKENYNAIKDKLITSFRNPRPNPSLLQNLAKKGTIILSHRAGEANTDINKIRVEADPSIFCKNFTNIKRVGT